MRQLTASTSDDSASLSGSDFEVPCNTVVVTDGRKTEHRPILFPVPHSDQRDGSLFRYVTILQIIGRHLVRKICVQVFNTLRVCMI